MARTSAKKRRQAWLQALPKARWRESGRRAAKPIDLYYWPTPNGWKVSIMLEECGLPYRVIPVNIATGEQFKPEFLEISPNNRMPAIVDPDGPGGRPISVFESGAILQYLGRKTGNSIRPTSAPASRSINGCSGRWPISAPRRARPTLPPLRAGAKRCNTRSTASPTRCNRLYGVMNRRLDGPRLPRRQLFDRRHGLRRLGQPLAAAGPGHRRIPAPQALARRVLARPAVYKRHAHPGGGGLQGQHGRRATARDAVRPARALVPSLPPHLSAMVISPSTGRTGRRGLVSRISRKTKSFAA